MSDVILGWVADTTHATEFVAATVTLSKAALATHGDDPEFHRKIGERVIAIWRATKESMRWSAEGNLPATDGPDAALPPDLTPMATTKRRAVKGDREVAALRVALEAIRDGGHERVCRQLGGTGLYLDGTPYHCPVCIADAVIKEAEA